MKVHLTVGFRFLLALCNGKPLFIKTARLLPDNEKEQRKIPAQVYVLSRIRTRTFTAKILNFLY